MALAMLVVIGLGCVHLPLQSGVHLPVSVPWIFRVRAFRDFSDRLHGLSELHQVQFPESALFRPLSRLAAVRKVIRWVTYPTNTSCTPRTMGNMSSTWRTKVIRRNAFLSEPFELKPGEQPKEPARTGEIDRFTTQGRSAR